MKIRNWLCLLPLCLWLVPTDAGRGNARAIGSMAGFECAQLALAFRRSARRRAARLR